MQKLEPLIERIIRHVNINLQDRAFDAGAFLKPCIPEHKLARYYAFCGVTGRHPLHFRFSRSSLAGSYFLGKCRVDDSVLYKSDIRGDELRAKGEEVHCGARRMRLDQDEVITISDSLLVKTLVHNHSHDPANPEVFSIKNAAAGPFANIHGSPLEGSFLGPFATVDLTALHGCIVGAYAYVQTGELGHTRVAPGEVWICQPEDFNFRYRFPADILAGYIRTAPGRPPEGRFMEFLDARKKDFHRVFDVVHLDPVPSVPKSAFLSRYAVIKPSSRLGANVLVAQRAYIENSVLGKGANAQENCFIVDSRLEGDNVTAHGAKLIHVTFEKKVFAGFNAFVHGLPEAPLTVGKGSIIMPHTIVDLKEPLAVPPDHLLWGYIDGPRRLKENSIALAELAKTTRRKSIGAMEFRGSGARFVAAFRSRIEHILKANGAFFDGRRNRGHAQKAQNIAYNIIQPYPAGARKGMFPTIDIQP
jgi:carbonic anhydrase/acetyltransferase-like protein (isoleucine patch superfamily)